MNKITFFRALSIYLLFLYLLCPSPFLHDLYAKTKSAGIEKTDRSGARYERGKRIYQKNCAYCHSKNGDGRNWIGAFIEPHPRDFTDYEVMKNISKERMLNSILNGRPGTAMPTWKGLLSIDEINDIILYIEKEFIKR